MAYSHEQGHDPLDRLLDSIDLDVDTEDLQLDQMQVHMLATIRRMIIRLEGVLMATLEDLNAAVAQTGVDAQAAADRVIAAITAATNAASAQVADLQAQVQTLIDGNASDITPEQLQAVADGLTAVDTTINSIAPEPVSAV